MFPVTIYHNPRCSTSRNALERIRQAGLEPTIIEYLHTPPSRDVLVALIRDAGLSVREALRPKEARFQEMELDDPTVSDEELLDIIEDNPILLNRPFVVTPLGTRLCRPLERIEEILPV